jgi:hypothetical protein
MRPAFPLVTQSAQAERIVALGQAHIMLVAQQRTMEEPWRLLSKSPKQKNLPRRALEEVGAAYDFGDAHGGVVNDDCELVGGEVIAAPDKEVRHPEGSRVA